MKNNWAYKLKYVLSIAEEKKTTSTIYTANH